MQTLTTTVSNILGYEVTDTIAKNWALKNYGQLATHIRNEFLDSVKSRKKTKKKLKEIKVFGTISKKYLQE